MKNIQAFIFLSFLSIAIFGCGSKSDTPPQNNNSLSLSSSNAQLGQYITAKPQGSFSGAVSYSVSPSAGASVLTNGNNAAAFFTAPGSYTITGKSSDNSFNESAVISASNSLYVPAETPDIVFGATDKVSITPAITGSTTFTFAATTAKTYSYLNSQIAYSNSSDGTTPVDILFNGVDTANTLAGSNIAVSLISFTIPANGTYDMQLCIGINCFIGSFTITDNAINFSFTNNNNLEFTSTSISR